MPINRREYLKLSTALAAGAAMPAISPKGANAQSRADTLRHVMGAVFSSLDPSFAGATRESFPFSVNVYDRLVGFGRREVPGGYMFDINNVRGEVAERIDKSADGRSYVLHIRPGTTWHDGSPVEIDDIKWSLDRAVTAISNAKAQMAAGSMTDPEQFKVVGERQIEIRTEKSDRLTLPTLCLPYMPMFNSKLVKRNAASDDPWGINWLKENVAGGGAYIVESNRPGQQVTIKRNENWKNGEGGRLPFFQRVIIQTIPDVSARASLLERGDADLTLDAAASDIPGLEQRGAVRVVAVPQSNAWQSIAFNMTAAPFDDPKLRQAVAAALPYEDMFKAALFQRGKPLFGAKWSEPPEAAFPQPMPNAFNLERARAILAESGYPKGLKINFSFPAAVSSTVEPMGALIKESLGKIGIEVTVQKLPDAQMVTMVSERRLHMFFDFFTSWMPTPDYVTRVFLIATTRWNPSGWSDPVVARLAEEARYERDQAVYDQKVKQIIKRFQEAVPIAMLWHPNHDAVIAKNIQGYTYYYHRGADYRDLRRV
ncbi:ABC transporter substrate-binding protein [Bosea sp. F3-2]|uniref:ABC transporter substrate-binding protein n=1 Tax=Bosea sp. F3-2 TaxID=2599640 RepID=UPI0011EF466B|nr:ABC transporter substrate-binding protein [Bosea sp. F3-2]QEL22919.1 ABC transporter substrate-binding protein [Bosea sp. F3-2]